MHTEVLVHGLLLWTLLASRDSRAFGDMGFVRTNMTHFLVNRRPFNLNGFNAYWLMYVASFPEEGRSMVSSAFQEASNHGLTLARTWAFRDGGYKPLQHSPGVYDEDMFQVSYARLKGSMYQALLPVKIPKKRAVCVYVHPVLQQCDLHGLLTPLQGLDYVISEAKKYGIYLVLSLVNNFESFGGRMQYIQWARDEGRHLSSDDDFYRDEVVKSYYKNHVRAILTRVNTITGVAYKDEAAIFAWELVNEPRCESDLSGRTLQAWIEDMAAHVKSIDSNHLLEVGLEGFYGETIPERKKINLGYELGTDFISNSQVEGIDFATIHAYPDMWMPGSTEQTQLAFLQSWIQSHVEDADAVLRKPLLISEFGKSSRLSNRTADEKAALYTTVYDAIYASARGGGACRGGIFWHLLLGVQEMEGLRDGYEVIFSESPSLGQIIANQSHRISNLNGGSETEKKLRPALPSGN
ncbi:Mannan endo-1,4-beta-mannosidase [Musa troglodytarum]|uniref:mannan endo-1,4-beta-mannosidase n=1 Tax=Musa troglodytarum TaxID=320322 RepID=A0A9E7FAD0_9LILI|nr:Mannan endo-1,4-beta-mannosidase [Musa troglodytarum]